MQHKLADVTFTDAYNLIEAANPINMILEQTAGFDQPTSATDQQSPMTRPARACYQLAA